MADNAPQAQEVVAQDAKTVGDENLEVREPQQEVVAEQVPAQVAQPRENDPSTVNVYETSVTTDTVITDPSDPLAVQVPDAGRGSLDLPIHRLGQPVVEDVFKAEASSEEKPAPRKRAAKPANDDS